MLAELAEVVDHVPRDVQGDQWCEGRQPVNLGCVSDLLERVAWDARLAEHLEACARVAEGPGGQLNDLPAESGEDLGIERH